MGWRRTKVWRAIVVAGVALVATFPVPTPAGAVVAPCGTREQTAPSGHPPAWNAGLPAGTALLGSGEVWGGREDYAMTFEGSAPDACVVGASVIGTRPDWDPWTLWHYRAGIRFSQPRFAVLGVHVYDTGDGIKPKDGGAGAAQDFTIAGSWVELAHDDCVENDYVHSGVVRDNLFDGCYVLFSDRPSSSHPELDGHGNVLTISGNVAALRPMRSVYKGPSPGTGGFFKWSGQAPSVVLTGNVLMASQPPNHGSLDPPPGPLVCSHNVIVWGGTGPFPAAAAWRARCPDTEITTNRTRYAFARNAWLARHPDVGAATRG
jgi:hypothetical protein